jgi:putative NADPH-quinone reductase
MKTLIIITHPNMQDSVINKRWTEELKRYPEKFCVHELYREYPDEKIDVEKEQKLVEHYERIVFQFPFYWFNVPSMLKKWMDEVLTHGWAYGSKSGFKMSGKKIALAISVGVKLEEYSCGGTYKYTMDELTRPYELSFEYVKADYRSFFVFDGLDHDISAERVDKSIPMYLDFIENF